MCFFLFKHMLDCAHEEWLHSCVEKHTNTLRVLVFSVNLFTAARVQGHVRIIPDNTALANLQKAHFIRSLEESCNLAPSFRCVG